MARGYPEARAQALLGALDAETSRTWREAIPRPGRKRCSARWMPRPGHAAAGVLGFALRASRGASAARRAGYRDSMPRAAPAARPKGASTARRIGSRDDAPYMKAPAPSGASAAGCREVVDVPAIGSVRDARRERCSARWMPRQTHVHAAAPKPNRDWRFLARDPCRAVRLRRERCSARWMPRPSVPGVQVTRPCRERCSALGARCAGCRDERMPAFSSRALLGALDAETHGHPRNPQARKR